MYLYLYAVSFICDGLIIYWGVSGLNNIPLSGLNVIMPRQTFVIPVLHSEPNRAQNKGVGSFFRGLIPSQAGARSRRDDRAAALPPHASAWTVFYPVSPTAAGCMPQPKLRRRTDHEMSDGQPRD